MTQVSRCAVAAFAIPVRPRPHSARNQLNSRIASVDLANNSNDITRLIDRLAKFGAAPCRGHGEIGTSHAQRGNVCEKARECVCVFLLGFGERAHHPFQMLLRIATIEDLLPALAAVVADRPHLLEPTTLVR